MTILKPPPCLLLILLVFNGACQALSSFSIANKATIDIPQAAVFGFENPPQKHRCSSSLHSLANPTSEATAEGATIADSSRPKVQYDSIVAGGGPAGLLTAIMLSQKYGPAHRIAVCERRLAIPPSPGDHEVWSDIARFYLLGIGQRGQTALRKFGVFDDFEKASVAVNGRRDWQPGATQVDDGRITPAKKEVVSRVLARDKLVGTLHEHIVDKYADANIDLLYGYEVDPISFGSSSNKDEEDVVSVRISKCGEVPSIEPEARSNNSSECVASQESEQLCDTETFQLATTKLLIGADGSARTVANAMERFDAVRLSKLNPLQRPFAQKPFRVTRFVDDNPKVYKSVPILLPPDWPCDLNYSARSSDNRITLEALPSDDKGNLCALLLMKPEDDLAQGNVDPAKLRAFFNKEFPQFGALVDDEEMARVAEKDSSTLPAFRYAGPRLSMGDRTLILGDSAHTVKPYFGLGANTALEDVQILSDALDEAADNGDDKTDAVPKAVKLFSDRRAADSAALVTISRNMDRPGKLFFVTFLLPLILDGIFHKIAPKIFGPNMFAMFQRQDIGFKQIQTKKRLDRAMQVACLGTMFAGTGMAVKAAIRALARVTGRSQGAISASMLAVAAIGMGLRKLAASREKQRASES